jgi:hypothetical protein
MVGSNRVVTIRTGPRAGTVYNAMAGSAPTGYRGLNLGGPRHVRER